jgi:predicted nucleic acid binding AN1-type Zn finger protein
MKRRGAIPQDDTGMDGSVTTKERFTQQRSVSNGSEQNNPSAIRAASLVVSLASKQSERRAPGYIANRSEKRRLQNRIHQEECRQAA